MDRITKIEKYRQILTQIVENHANAQRRSDQVALVPICDPKHDNYLLMRVGWDRVGRAHHILFHFRLLDGKVWIEWDGIEYGIANDLIAAGIPQEDIMMASYSKEPHSLTELMAA